MLFSWLTINLTNSCTSFNLQRHPDGIISVAFKEFEAADACVLSMNQRWYAGRQLVVGQWDGLTNFQVEETGEEREERLSKWEKFLHDDEEDKAQKVGFSF